jgi:hypothetical protein
MSDINETVVSKIRKLLALAGSPNQHEAQLALSRAHEFMQKHNLSMLDVTAEKSDMVEIDCDSSMRSRLWIEEIHKAMASLNYCFMYYNTEKEKDYKGRVETIRTIKIVGRKDNAQTAQVMSEWLIGVCETVCKTLLKEDRNGYRQGFADGIADQVNDIKMKERSGNVTSALVVIEDEAAKYVNSLYKLSPDPRIAVTVSGEAYDEGRERGRNYNLNRQIREENKE